MEYILLEYVVLMWFFWKFFFTHHFDYIRSWNHLNIFFFLLPFLLYLFQKPQSNRKSLTDFNSFSASFAWNKHSLQYKRFSCAQLNLLFFMDFSLRDIFLRKCVFVNSLSLKRISWITFAIRHLINLDACDVPFDI